jgi:hypothetical protein
MSFDALTKITFVEASQGNVNVASICFSIIRNIKVTNASIQFTNVNKRVFPFAFSRSILIIKLN